MSAYYDTHARERQSRGDRAYTPQDIPRAVSLAAFLAASQPPTFLIEPIIQRGFLYTLTARTFHGKTTLLVYTALALAAVRLHFAGNHTEHGRVIYFAGENPDDIAYKFRVACDFWGLDPDDLPISIVPGAFDLTGNIDSAYAEAARGGDLAAIIFDTSSAYRFDADEDDNQASKKWGQALRTFTQLRGNPAVLVAAHPIKAADRNCLLPRGGGGFLNEVDGNLTLWADLDAGTTDLHWQGKLRGPGFKPIRFNLTDQPHPSWQYADGNPVNLKVAVPSQDQPTGAAKGKDGLSNSEALASIMLQRAMERSSLRATVFDGEEGAVCLEKDWREIFYREAMPEDAAADTKQRAFVRARAGLIRKNRIGCLDGMAWPWPGRL